MKHACWKWVGLISLAAVGGCNLLTPLIFMGEHKKLVSPEFDKLAGHRVAVHVWTDPATLFDYPFARFELATYVAEKLGSQSGQRNLDVEVVDSRDVEDFVQRNLSAQVDPVVVGKHVNADYVIFLEILDFQIRDPMQSQFLRGRIHASVSVHDLRAGADAVHRYELTPVDCIYPESSPVLFSATNSPMVREGVYRMFADRVARKFYEHTLDM